MLEALEMKPSESLKHYHRRDGGKASLSCWAPSDYCWAIGRIKNRSITIEKKCIIEGSFTINKFSLEALFNNEDLDYDPICILRREITPNGKSRAFINDTPVRLETLRSVGNMLVDIHSQHDSLLLSDNTYQLEIIDAYAGNEKELNAYQKSYRRYRQAQSEYERLRAEAARLRQEDDFNRFLLEELEKAALVAGEQAQLEEDLQGDGKCGQHPGATRRGHCPT